MPDRSTVSAAARKVWEKYYNRPDIETVQTDSHGNKLTPDDSDNCDQMSAGKDSSVGDGFEKSVLSKVYKKSGTPVMDELRKRGMLK